MRILHTSDWHLGKMLYKRSRIGDHRAVLAEIVGIAQSHSPDLIIHSGDLFDNRRPSYQDEGLAIDTLRNLATLAPVVVLRGNHDSPSWFQIIGRAFGPHSNIHLIDKPREDPKDGGVLSFTGADGTILRLGVLPFIDASATDLFIHPEQWQSEYAQTVGRLERELATELQRDLDPSREVAVFAAHEYLTGAELSGTERATNQGYATSPDDIPAVAYAAFGHIHNPQPLPHSKVTGYYAGSPIQLDLGEAGQTKNVLIVDLRPGQPADITPVPLTAGRTLRKFTGTLDKLQAQASSFGDEMCMFFIETQTDDPTLYEQVHALVPTVTILGVRPIPLGSQGWDLAPDDCEDAEDAEPDLAELFDEFLATRPGVVADVGRVRAQFRQLLACLDDERPFTLPDVDNLLTTPLDTTSKESGR
ncbi:metallophosphoesterase family protein [Nocardia sp. CA-107356]|uniref:metallophosphoesterase family protein n=1 Tax=Nocardia sp. CA-107356 TaxID=3239972 RepID=UPI003D91793C